MLKFLLYCESKAKYLSSRLKLNVLSLCGYIKAGSNCRFDYKAVFDSEGMGKGSGVILGDSCHIKKYAIIAPRTGVIKIGSRVNINPFCFLYGYGGITIGDNCRIAAGCKLIAFNHKFDLTDQAVVEQGNSAKGIVIGDNVWLGADVKILDGVELGANCVVGAGSIVTSSVPDNAIVAGNPARIIRMKTDVN